MTTVRVEHLDALKLCRRGSRAFAARHGLNWQSFLQQGIDSQQLLDLNDPLTRRVVEYAEEHDGLEKGNGRV